MYAVFLISVIYTLTFLSRRILVIRLILNALATEMSAVHPPKLIAASKTLAEMALSLTQPETPYNTPQIQDTVRQVKMALQC
jgi:hypothetical protein